MGFKKAIKRLGKRLAAEKFVSTTTSLRELRESKRHRNAMALLNARTQQNNLQYSIRSKGNQARKNYVRSQLSQKQKYLLDVERMKQEQERAIKRAIAEELLKKQKRQEEAVLALARAKRSRNRMLSERKYENSKIKRQTSVLALLRRLWR